MLKISKAAAVMAAFLVVVPAFAQSPASMSGCVVKDGSGFSLTDDATKNKVQLMGGKLKAGQHVDVTGTSASGMFNVTGVKQSAGTCASSGHSGGMHLGKASLISIAIVGGVVIYAVVHGAGRIGPAF